jgi:GNAT superfamily N-acetyltransferase
MTIERMEIPVEQASLSSPVFNMMYLRELDRLKENYTKDPDEHQVIVAKNIDDEVIGYVDIDRRNIFNKRFPTPYVSDLVVQPLWRNKGVAKSLLAYCTDIVCKIEWFESHIHLLVETENKKAINLYSKLLYVPIQGETGPIDDLSKIKIIPINGIVPISTYDYLNSDSKNLNVIGGEIKHKKGNIRIEGGKVITLKNLLEEDSLSLYDRILLRKEF